jgi:DNA-directed RNA polymerase subunit M/transcription elongation factor TFIIS
MGKNRYTIIVCAQCKRKVRKPNKAVNRANKFDRPLFCNSFCANARQIVTEIRACLLCGRKFKTTPRKRSPKHCSDACAKKAGASTRSLLTYEKYVAQWLAGKVSGLKANGQLSGHVRRFKLEEAKRKCSLCAWSGVNIRTGRSVLQIDHIDGKWRNSKPTNLRVVCPNCHSMSATYGSLNLGNGRPYRRFQRS